MVCGLWEVLTVSGRKALLGSVLGNQPVLGQQDYFRRTLILATVDGDLKKADLLQLEVEPAVSCVSSLDCESMARLQSGRRERREWKGREKP